MVCWAFNEAERVIDRIRAVGKTKVVLATGFGASGAAHIGSYAEIFRTRLVQNAIKRLDDSLDTELIVFSDDYDAFRRVPDGLPATMNEYLGLPLTSVPDPFGEYTSFGARNTALLDQYSRNHLGFTPKIMSATEQYESGAFNAGLLDVLRNYDAIMDIMMPTLGEARRATYSLFLPRDPDTGRILQIPMVDHDAETGEVVFRRDDGSEFSTTVFNGNVKNGWKIDWAMRWGVLGVDYEMSGKDLIDSVKASSKIARVLGHQPPVNMTYELFLDAEGRKISKSLGNGVSVEEWLQYGTRESLAQFMFQNPRAAKSIHLGLIPAVTDEYLKNLSRINNDQVAGSPESLDNPAWHIHQGDPPAWSSDVSYSLLINLASVTNATDPDVLREYLATYRSIADEDRPIIDELIPRVIRYCERFVYPEKELRAPSESERLAIEDLIIFLQAQEDGLDGEAYQFYVYEVGKAHYGKERLREWFQAIYEVVFGSSNGPRFGTFIAAYGRRRSIDLLRARL